MKQAFLFIIIILIAVCFIHESYKNGIKEGFEIGAMNQVTYQQAFPNDGYMGYGFREYLKNDLKMLSPLGMKMAYANYMGLTDANIKDTTGLQIRIDSSEEAHYQAWLKETKRWKDSIDNTIKK